LGNSAHIYDDLAPRFTDKFHVIALTRRGHGDSDSPENSYDVDTLTEDVSQFMDALKIKKAILVGHSIAYIELCRFSALHPERALKFIFLDAAYDRTKFKVFAEKHPLKGVQPPEQDCHTIEEYITYTKRIAPELADIWSELWDEETLHIVKISADGKVVDKMPDEIAQKIIDASRNYPPEDLTIKVPALSIYAIWDHYLFPDYLTEEQEVLLIEFQNQVRLPIQRECIKQFRQNVPHAKIIEIPQGHHYCFIKQEELVYEEMRKFLLE